MLKLKSLPRRIAIGFVALVLLTCGLGGFALYELSAVAKTTRYMAADPYPGTVAIYEIEASSGQQFGAVARLVLAREADRAARTAELKEIEDTLAKVTRDYEVTITQEENRAMFGKLAALRSDYSRISGEIVAHLGAGKAAEAAAQLNAELNPAFNALHRHLDTMSEWNRKNAEVALARIEASVNNGIRGDLVALALSLVLATAVSLWIIRSVRAALVGVSGTIAAGSEQVASASGQVSSSSQALASGASEQAASLEESSSSLEEMASMTRRNAEAATKAKALAGEARTAADAGSTDVAAMTRAMHEIKSSSDEIAKIVKTIDEIAFQTNILALNAAVEAARAGEAGLGFAVVADEVRSLAQRSAQASRETAAKIESAISRTSHGVAMSDKVSAHLGTIVTRVREVDELIAEVATASREQSEGVTQINAAVSDMDKVVQSNAASAEESAAAAEELSQQADALKRAVATLRDLAGVNPSASAEVRPVPSAPSGDLVVPRLDAPRKSSAPAAVLRRPQLHRAPAAPHHSRPSPAPLEPVAAPGKDVDFFN